MINRTLAQRYFPNGNAIGSSVKLPKLEDSPPTILSAPKIADSWLQIVGIVNDARNDGLRDPIKPAVYVPYTLTMSPGTQILVRSEVPPLTLLHAVQKQVVAVNPDQQTYSMARDLETWITDLPEWQQERLACPDLWNPCMVGAGARGGRFVQRGIVRGGAAHQRVWHPHGAGCTARGCDENRFFVDGR